MNSLSRIKFCVARRDEASTRRCHFGDGRHATEGLQYRSHPAPPASHPPRATLPASSPALGHSVVLSFSFIFPFNNSHSRSMLFTTLMIFIGIFMILKYYFFFSNVHIFINFTFQEIQFLTFFILSQTRVINAFHILMLFIIVNKIYYTTKKLKINYMNLFSTILEQRYLLRPEK